MKKRLLAMLVAAVLLLGLLASCGGGGQSDAKAGATPEKTVETFLNALKKQDLDTMLACCYIEDYYDVFSFQDCVVDQGYMDIGSYMAPTDYAFYREAMAVYRRGDLTRYIQVLANNLLLLTDENYQEKWADYAFYNDKANIILYKLKQDDTATGWASDFVDAVDPDRLKGLEIKRVEVEGDDTEVGKERQKRYWGRDQVVMVDAELELEGATFLKGFTLVEVDGRWQIVTFGSLRSGMGNMSLTRIS